MKYFTDLNIYGHLSLELSADNNTSGAINNVPTANISFLRLTGDSPVISGFADGGENNKLLIISHAGTGNLTLKNLSNLSVLGNRIVTGYNEDLLITAGHNSILIYDSYDEIWRMIAIPSDIRSVTGTVDQIIVNPTTGDIILSLPQDIATDSVVTFGGLNLSSNSPMTIDADNDLNIVSTGSVTITPDSNGNVVVDNLTASTDKNTGALVVYGGIGIGGDANIFGTISAGIVASTNSIGSEGGQIELALPASNTTLSGKVVVDVYQNKFRIFETTGSNRGVYIDLTSASNSVGTNLLSGAGVSTDTLDDVVERGATTDKAITITATTESANRTSGALIVSGGIGVDKRIQTKNLTVNSVKQRAGISANLTSGIIDLSADDYQFYCIDQNDDFLADISFNNGTPGEIFYLKIKSDGQQYTWDISNNEIKWPSDVNPSASQINKTDLYHFICLSATEYLGTYVFNYT